MAVKVLSNVKHNGAVYEAGEVISDITEKQEKALIEAGVAKHVNASEATEAPEAPAKEAAGKKARTTVVPQDGKPKASEAVKEAPAASPELDKASGTVSGEGQEDGEDSNVLEEFMVGEDRYYKQETKNGQVQHRVNGKVISKVDYAEAKAKAEAPDSEA